MFKVYGYVDAVGYIVKKYWMGVRGTGSLGTGLHPYAFEFDILHLLTLDLVLQWNKAL